MVGLNIIGEKMEQLLKVNTELLNIFNKDDFYLVGGCVRDAVMGNKVKDFDLCGPLLPDAVKSIVEASGLKTFNVNGLEFGTISFFIEVDGVKLPIEYTTFRSEIYTSKSRKPEVKFVPSLDEDLARRDFTINAMVLKSDGSIYDPFGGRLDILGKLIKTVGLPKDRIKEDPLRMLRAARFASKLEFDVDPNMIGKMRYMASSIVNVSKERWVQEIDKLLMGKDPAKGLDVLMHSEVAKYVIPEAYLSLHDEYAYKEVCKALQKESDLDSKWAILHYFIGYPYTQKEDRKGISFPGNDVVRKELLEGICSRLKFSNSRRDNLLKNKIIFDIRG